MAPETEPSKNEKYWVSVSRASAILGIRSEVLNSYIQNGQIPFRKHGNRYLLNWRLVSATLAKADMDNMKRAQRAISASPISRGKVTGDINNAPRRTANVRAVR